MIRYALACRQGHAFESWFQHSDAFDEQANRGLIACPTCGSTDIEKALMAPRLSRSVTGSKPHVANDAEESAQKTPPSDAKAPVAIMSPQERELRRKLKELRDHLTKTAEHVGPRFPEEARKMHYGESDHRSIYGEASADEARALIEEGIEFHPLPVLPDEQN
jgi:hypothetical protein